MGDATQCLHLKEGLLMNCSLNTIL